MSFYITKDDTTELMVILNLFQDLSAEKDKKRLAVRCWNKLTFVQFAHARHSQTSLALLSLNRKFQHDIWSHLLFILSFWWCQFNTYVLLPNRKLSLKRASVKNSKMQGICGHSSYQSLRRTTGRWAAQNSAVSPMLGTMLPDSCLSVFMM